MYTTFNSIYLLQLRLKVSLGQYRAKQAHLTVMCAVELRAVLAFKLDRLLTLLRISFTKVDYSIPIHINNINLV